MSRLSISRAPERSPRLTRVQSPGLVLGACALGVCLLAARDGDLSPQPGQSTSQSATSDTSKTKAQEQRRSKLAPSGAFFEPPFAKSARPLVTGKRADGSALTLELEDYKRFLVARADRAFLDEFVFARLIAHECRARRLARTAPMMARANSLRHFRLQKVRDPDGRHQRAMANAELLRMRVDALVRATRTVQDRDLRLAFDEQYGLGGVRVAVRQVFVSMIASERRLRAAGATAPSEAEIDAAARKRCAQLHDALALADVSFADVVRQTDDPATKTLLADPRASKTRAGVIEGYDYQRYGPEFAKAVRSLAVGATSKPVRTSHGYHIIEVMQRTRTRFEDVAATLRKRLASAPAGPRETQELRTRLFKKYAISIRD